MKDNDGGGESNRTTMTVGDVERILVFIRCLLSSNFGYRVSRLGRRAK